MKNKKGRIVVLSGVIIIIAYFMPLLPFIHINQLYFNILFILATIFAGYTIAKNAIQALFYHIVGIDALVTIAVIGAMLIGEYFEGAAVTFLFILGSFLESKTLEKTRSSLKTLMDLSPKKAIIIRDGQHLEINAQDVKVKERVIVKPGGKIPVDGKIVEGEATVNQASITGESNLVNKKTGDIVYSGTVNESGYLEIIAEKVGKDTSFSKIMELVEEAQDSKAKTQKFIEKFAKYYTPGIILLSLIVYLVTRNINLTLTLLVISCPGALVISTPVTIVAGIGNAAKNGILVKGGEYLEIANKIKVIAFDKTGTLTIGKPKVIDIYTKDISKQELLFIAASIEINSEHHLGKAIIEEAKKEMNADLSKATQFKVYKGKGISGQINNQNYFMGNRKLMEENRITITKDLEEQLNVSEKKTVVLVADETKTIGLITIADEIRPDAYEMVQKLKKNGLKKVIMLTGDHEEIAKEIGNQVNIEEVYADLLPEDKLVMIQNLKQQYKVAMVGDGINDAPSLALADLGIAIGGIGTDVAMETSDVVLLSNQLSKISYLIRLSQATSRNLKQNLTFALVVVFILLMGVLLGKVFMAFGMFVHEFSVLLVILNAMRLNTFKEKSQ